MVVRLEFKTQDSEEIALAKRYWAMDENCVYLEKVSELVPFRKIIQSGLVAKYVRTFCKVFDENQACIKCEGPIVITSRSEVRRFFQLSEFPCDACSEILHREELERSLEAEVELQKHLVNRISYMRGVSISYTDLKDDQRLILSAIETLITSRLAQSTFTEKDCEALVPWESSSYTSRLFREGVIFDDPEFSRPGTYYLRDGKLQAVSNSLQFFLPADDKLGRHAESLKVITERQFKDSEAITNLWFDYAVGDVLRYLIDQCRIYNHNLNCDDIEKIKAIVRGSLKTYSVSQLWFIMWKVVRDAASLANREYYNCYKAAATIPNKIRSQVEKADKQGGIDKFWSRPEHHIAGSLGMAFLTYFEIDEFTEGKQALTIFAQLRVQACVGESQAVANIFMRGAQSRNVSLWSMEQFAELIRSGFDTNDALNELVRLNPQVFSI